MFKSDKNKIIQEIVEVSKYLHDDCRYDPKVAKLRLEQLRHLLKALELLAPYKTN